LDKIAGHIDERAVFEGARYLVNKNVPAKPLKDKNDYCVRKVWKDEEAFQRAGSAFCIVKKSAPERILSDIGRGLV
jgi:hypothetical protein